VLVEWIDISVPLSERLPAWPGDPGFERVLASSIAAGDSVNLSTLRMSAHAGTHVDAPLHFRRDGQPIDAIPLDVLCGPCRVADCGDAEVVDAGVVARIAPCPGERILLRTRNSHLWARPEFQRDSVGLNVAAARAFREAGVALLGIDYLSMASFRQGGIKVHHILLGAGIPLIEGLDLSGVAQCTYDLICAPLLLAGADGAPARAFIRRRGARA
jgi:arylformamidase